MIALRPIPRSADRRSAVRRALFAGRARLRADLQGVRRVQLRAGRDGAARRAGAGALARLPGGQGLPGLGRDRARPGLRRRDHGDHGLADRALRARAAGQPGRPHAVHVDDRRDLHPRGRGADDLRLRRLSAAAVSDRCLVPVRKCLSRRHSGQQAGRLGRLDRRRSGRGACDVLPAHQDRPRATRGRRRPSGRAVGRHPDQLDLVRGLAGRRPRCAGRRRRCGAPSSACSSRSRSWR